ncbi:MAG: SsrA-binding protein SmpB [Gemmatimonadetes bacterium]|nr:SsrA-binding protein SmpB [Gemmatimonadota bacterium]MDA1103033.1 SsrA-binding protein SmpB [Gemmatimonadota bacterium]
MTEGPARKVVARNRKARHEFEILETVEAGMELRGPEVKSMRAGGVSFQDSFARVDGGQVWLHSLHISPYEQANRANVDPVRTRRLLLNRGEIRKLAVKTDEKGLTLVPLEIYFSRGYAKVTLGVARGKKLYDKREDLKRRQQDRDARRAMENH